MENNQTDVVCMRRIITYYTMNREDFFFLQSGINAFAHLKSSFPEPQMSLFAILKSLLLPIV